MAERQQWTRKIETDIALACQREIGNFILRWDRPPLATPRLPSLFSKSMGFTLWGIVDDPISPALVICTINLELNSLLKY